MNRSLFPSWPRGRPSGRSLFLPLLALFGLSLSTLSTYELLAPKAWATEQYVNGCQVTLNGGITATAVSIVISSTTCLGGGSTVPTSGTFTGLVDQEGIEIVSVSGTTLTAASSAGNRVTEYGTNAAHSSGAVMTLLESKRAFDQIKADAAAPALAGAYPSL